MRNFWLALFSDELHESLSLHKTSLAREIVAALASLGGVTFPVMINHLTAEVGFNWALRISGFLILALLVVGNLTPKARLP